MNFSEKLSLVIIKKKILTLNYSARKDYFIGNYSNSMSKNRRRLLHLSK